MAMATKRGIMTTFPLVLTATQVERLRAIAALRSSEHTRVSVSSVAREVIELGLSESIRSQQNDSSVFDIRGEREGAA